MQRLGKNQGRYHGEMIDIDAVREEIHQLAIASGWRSETFLDRPDTLLRGYSREHAGAKANIYIGTGIHGDEPAGPLAVLKLLQEKDWPAANLWLVPCLNPTGFRRNTRENSDGIDLNRDYRHAQSAEIAAHIQWLERQPRFDLSLLLHEDWESNGFYVYELNPHHHPALAESFVNAVQSLCPIETAEVVDSFPCWAGIIRPELKPEDRPQWAEAIYLIAHKSRQSYTLETPSDYPLSLRVEAHVAATRSAFQVVQSAGQTPG